MKKSRIICSIITVIYILLSLGLIFVLSKSNMFLKSNVPLYIKAIYLGLVGTCIIMYVFVKNKLKMKLNNKVLSITISKLYCYLYLAVIILLSRGIAAYLLKGNSIAKILPNFNLGLGSYINYGLGRLINSQMYANCIINSILVFASCVFVKKIMLKVIENDTIATATSIMFIFIPNSIMSVTQYVRYGYNVLIMLLGIFVFAKIIDEVKKFGKKNKKYIIYSVLFGLIQSLDIVLGGTYVMWAILIVIITFTAMYVDTIHLRFGFKNKLGYKGKRLIEKIESINISKLISVTLISLTISGITTLLCYLFTNTNNYQLFSVTNSINVLMHAKNYYLVIIIFTIVFEIIGVILKRKLDIKMFMIKTTYVVIGCVTFFMIDGVHASYVFDTLLVLFMVINMCNICYNREERIKLLKEKN